MLLAALLLAIPTDMGSLVDSTVANAMKEAPAVGIQVAIARRGRIVFEKGYGYADLEQRVRVGKDTVFHIDSITKHITAGLVAKLATQGKVDLAARVDNYVKGFKGAATVDQILSHTSGLGSYNDSSAFNGGRDRLDWSKTDVLDLINKQEPVFPEGTSWSYSNSGFYLAGLVAESVSGMPYPQALDKFIFRPFGMTKSVVGLNTPIIPNRAHGYELFRGKPINADPISWQTPFSAGAICSTASDLLRYEIGIESDAPLFAMMRKPHVMRDGTTVDYGLGTRLGDLERHRAVGHTGSGGGYNNVLVSFPDDGLMIAVLSNVESERVSRLVCYRLSRKLLGLPHAKMKDLPLESEIRALHYGTYRSGNGNFTVFVKDGKIRYKPAGASGDGMAAQWYLGNGRAASEEYGEARLLTKNGEAPWIMFYACGMLDDVAQRIAN